VQNCVLKELISVSNFLNNVDFLKYKSVKENYFFGLIWFGLIVRGEQRKTFSENLTFQQKFYSLYFTKTLKQKNLLPSLFFILYAVFLNVQ